MTRRRILASTALAAWGAVAGAQDRGGMASRGVKPVPRGAPSGRPFDSKFVDVAKAAGLIKPVIYGQPDRSDYILESMGCGCAFVDYDNDGWLDIVMLTGSRFQAAPADAVIRLYHNNRDGTFVDVTERAGLGQRAWSSGITVGDFDNDGFDDLFITCWGNNLLFHNNGNGTFTDVTANAGLSRDGAHYATGCTWIDYDRDGKLDLFVAHYVVFDPRTIPPAGKSSGCNWKGIPVNCGPAGLKHDGYRLYHNNGDGTFTDVSVKSGVAALDPGYALTTVATDLDGDGWPDLYIACDTTPSQLLKNNRDGTFAEVGLESGVAVNEDGHEQAGMGVAVADFNGDGFLDLFKTHFVEDTPALYQGNGKGFFRDVTIRSGLGVETRYVGWGTAFADFDNDGYPDLLFASGMVYAEMEVKLPEYPRKSPLVLFRNLGNARFEQLLNHAGLSEAHSSRGLAVGDFDNDGDIDVLVVNLNEPPTLLRNDCDRRAHWLKVLLQGVRSNRSAIGAHVTVTSGTRRQVQCVLAQSSYLSVNDRRLHFGLGDATSANVQIRWPNGQLESLSDVSVDRLIVIREGAGVVRSERMAGLQR